MNDFLLWVEQLPPSTFVRESPSLWGFPMFLFGHTLGLSLLVGASSVVALALLGFWPAAASTKALERLFTIVWVGFGINLFTGLGLLMADASITPMKLDFWIKMTFVAAGMVVSVRMRRTVFQATEEPRSSASATRLAWASLVCWFGAIIAGRLIAYVGG